MRESFLSFVLGPIIVYYTRRRATGREKLAGIRGPAILVANHRSHMDTPVILGALPRRLRRRTVVGAAADYFYGNRLIALLVSLIFNTVPVDRCGGGLDKRAAGHLDRLLDDGWSLLMYPEGTRSRDGGTGRLRRGAAVLAARHGAPIVPIRVSGTWDAMPPGRFWPRRRHERLVPTRHKVDIVIGDPIAPSEDSSSVILAVQRFFDGSEMNETRRRGRAASQSAARVSTTERTSESSAPLSLDPPIQAQPSSSTQSSVLATALRHLR